MCFRCCNEERHNRENYQLVCPCMSPFFCRKEIRSFLLRFLSSRTMKREQLCFWVIFIYAIEYYDRCSQMMLMLMHKTRLKDVFIMITCGANVIFLCWWLHVGARCSRMMLMLKNIRYARKMLAQSDRRSRMMLMLRHKTRPKDAFAKQ